MAYDKNTDYQAMINDAVGKITHRLFSFTAKTQFSIKGSYNHAQK